MTTPAIRRAVASDDSGDLESDGEPAPDIILAPGQSRTNVAGSDSLLLRSPVKEDGRFIHQLIRQCPPLDLNSIYTYLLLCEHFSQTCVVAEIDGRICGFVSAYRHPERTDVLFVWQVAVHESARGLGLGQRMLKALLARPVAHGVQYLETTVGPDNVPSRRMFQGLADDSGALVEESALFESALFGADAHDDECLLRIGPITQNYQGTNS